MTDHIRFPHDFDEGRSMNQSCDRRSSSANRVSQFLRLDLSEIGSHLLEHGQKGELIWRRNGRQVSSVSYRVGFDYIDLAYTLRSGSKPKDIVERFSFSFTDQPFGGCRRWFKCNGCQARCRVLLGAGRFRCRKCFGARYPSQYDPFRVKGEFFAKNAIKRLGGAPGVSNLWLAKPKRMHWQTYQRLQQKIWEVEAIIEADALVVCLRKTGP